ncbi:hypothetical protein D3C72_2070590 [compost metagenome]
MLLRKATPPPVVLMPPRLGTPSGKAMGTGALSRVVPFLCIHTFFMVRKSTAAI